MKAEFERGELDAPPSAAKSFGRNWKFVATFGEVEVVDESACFGVNLGVGVKARRRFWS